MKGPGSIRSPGPSASRAPKRISINYDHPMDHLLRALFVAGAILAGGGALLTHDVGRASWGPFLAVALGCIVGLGWLAVRRRRLAARLPKGLRGLWYRVQTDHIEFHWRWSSSGRRLRILRSRSTTIRSPRDAERRRGDIVLVYDGLTPPHATDEKLSTGVTYRYAFFVGYEDGRWSRPVRQIITPLSPGDVAHIEATYSRSSVPLPGYEQRSTLGKTLAPDQLYDPHGTDVEWGRARSEATPYGAGGLLSVASEVVSGVVVDGVFDLLGRMADDELAGRGWVKVV